MLFERYDERIDNIMSTLSAYGINSLQEVLAAYSASEIDVDAIVDSIQPFACSDARYAFKIIVGIVCLKEIKSMNKICDCIGDVLQSFCINRSVAQRRNIGKGHGELVKRLLDEENHTFFFVAGHESFAAAEGALAIAKAANSYRKTPLVVGLLGLGKPTADIISRYNGFKYVKTNYDHNNSRLGILETIKYSDDTEVRCYGVNSVDEGVAVLEYEQTSIIMTGNSTNHVKFTDATVAIYKKNCFQKGIRNIFCIASGGGTGRTMHPDNVQAGAASYGMTDTLGKTHCDIQFAGSSSVPSHVQMVGFIGIGNNPLVGLSVTIANNLITR